MWLAVAVVVCAVAGPRASAPPVATLLDRYGAGEFTAVAAELDRTKDFNELLKQLKATAPAWIAAGGAEDHDRRQLAAATFALEAGRAGSLEDWKLVQRWMDLENIYWHAPAQLVEWGCSLLRSRATPQPIERVWQLAAIAVVDRVNDYEFLIGSPWDGRANMKDEIIHLDHASKRFPYERRLALAQGIAAEWRTFPYKRSREDEAQRIFEVLRDDPSVGAEATVRLGFQMSRSNNNLPAAMKLFDSAEERTREPYVLYLARYLRGQALERQRKPAEAERAYWAALAAVPAAQSASFALSSLLAVQGHRADASQLVDAALTATPLPLDPWRAYGEADARFWPELIAALHEEVAARLATRGEIKR